MVLLALERDPRWAALSYQTGGSDAVGWSCVLTGRRAGASSRRLSFAVMLLLRFLGDEMGGPVTDPTRRWLSPLELVSVGGSVFNDASAIG
jgi:hypothetical protein